MLRLLPMPKQISSLNSAFRMSLDTQIVLCGACGTMARVAARQLQSEIHAACGFTPLISCGKYEKSDIRLRVTGGAAQGYTLNISDDGVVISGNDENGLMHGAQTLRQIIRQCGWELCGVAIEDAPVYKFRGYYYDQTRGRVNTLEWLKSLADEACFYKLNQLQLYIEHTYMFRDMPELWNTAVTPLTAEQILELDDYCSQRGVELVPSLSSFGHLFELLSIKRYAPLCELRNAPEYFSTMPNRMAHHTIDPEDERSFALVASMIDEFMPLFRSDKFNICADETFDLGKDKNADKDVKEIYLSFLKKLCSYVSEKGKTPMFWGDIVLLYPRALTSLPKNAICLNWQYSANVDERNTKAFADVGAVQYVCPGVASWNCWMPDFITAYENISKMSQFGKNYGAIGLLNTDWGDYGHISDPRFSLPGMIVGACASWGELLPREELQTAVSHIAYKDNSGRLASLMTDCSVASISQWHSLVKYKECINGRLHGCSDYLLPAIDDDELSKADELINNMQDKLAKCSANMPYGGRELVSRIIISAEAVYLWNHVQACAAKGVQDAALADRLLRWLHKYEAMWRETSYESELWRVRDVASWYANRLQ